MNAPRLQSRKLQMGASSTAKRHEATPEATQDTAKARSQALISQERGLAQLS